METEWEYEEIAIGDVKELLNDYDIQVDSPDGWVEVTDFIEKEERPEHILNVETGETIRCSDTHLFQTNFGWMFAEDIVNRDDIYVLHSNGEYEKANCIVTDKLIPIVDITVDHENHRYFTNNISSHNTGGGKSLLKGHFAASCLMHGKNVLYITAEMSENEINKRIDANIMDLTMSEVPLLPKDVFVKKVSRFKDKTPGKLITKEYATGSAHAGNIRHLLNELRLKKDFVPDIIFVDYLNIFASSRLRGSDKSNTYSLIKSVAEEMRGLAMEFDVPIVTSSQYNRQGYNNSDVDLTNTSESMGIAHTADAIFALITSEELDSLNQIMIKQLKNRWNDLNYYRRFVVGIDRSRMKIYNLEESAIDNVKNHEEDMKQKVKGSDDDDDIKEFSEFRRKKGKRNFQIDEELT